jgi:hypothetical protein
MNVVLIQIVAIRPVHRAFAIRSPVKAKMNALPTPIVIIKNVIRADTVGQFQVRARISAVIIRSVDAKRVR